jgi:ribosome biogenesis protein Nip4
MKNLINDLIYEKDISVPKKISIKLKSKNYVEKRTEGNKVFDVPTLTQVQNYVKYLKSKVCTNNNVQDIKKFVDDHQYYEDINPKEFFIFGADVGNGTEENHLQISFTSTELLSRIPSGVVFHCDATYKIVKIGFPLIVFGMSDINRKFYPLAFAFSSHEQNEDFRKFFINLTKITMKLNITLAPKFMCIDASKAMAFAINKVFPLCIN